MSPDRLVTDLAKAMVQKPSGTGLGIASATIKDFDTTTFGNRLDYYGTELVDVPVLSGTDALSYRPGDEVILLTWHPVDGHRRRGLGSFSILGRIVRPGAANAERTIQFLQSELAKQIVDEIVQELLGSPAGRTLIDGIVEDLLVSPAGQDLAAFVIGQRAHAAAVATDQATTSTAFTDLATVGPVVPNVPVSAAGKAIVWVGSHSFATSQTATSSQFGVMSFQVTGATARSPSNDRAFTLGYVDVDELSAVDATATTAVLLTGLNEGNHTFTAKYKSINGDSYHFENRTLVVIGL